MRQSKPTRRKHVPHTSYKWLWFLVIIGLAMYYLLPRFGEISISAKTIMDADPAWVLLATFTMCVTYGLSAMVVKGSTLRPLPYSLTLLVQVAATVANRITPKGLGGAAFTEQYLERRGLPRAEAAVSTTFIYASGIFMHTVLLLGALSVIQYEGIDRRLLATTPHIIMYVLLTLTGVVLVMVFVPRIRRLLRIWTQEFIKGFRVSFAHPVKLLQLLVGSAGITVFNAVTLYFSLEAFDSPAPFGFVLFVYLAGSAVASPAPTPSGLGALEAALVIGLASFTTLDQALSGVVTFRLITFWLPILPGLLALTYVRSHVFTTVSGRNFGGGS